MAPGLCDHWSFLRPLFGDAAASSSTARTTAAVSKAPRAVVEEAFAEHVRGFMESNPGLDETFEVVFEGIFMSLEDDFVLPDPSEVAAAEAAARDSFAVELPSLPPAGRARKGKKGGKKKTRK